MLHAIFRAIFQKFKNPSHIPLYPVESYITYMDHWEFPETIKANSEVKIYIEFCHNFFSWSWRLDQGIALYHVKGVGLKFMVKATHVANGGSDMDVLVIFLNFANMEYEVSKNNWKHDEVVVFDLAYERESGKFYSKKLIRGFVVPMSAIVEFASDSQLLIVN